MLYHLISIVLAVCIDQVIGDPRWLPHPVRGFGKMISTAERLLNKGRHKRKKGVLMLLSVLFITCTLSMCVVWAAYHLHVVIGILIESVLIATTIAAKGLKEAGLSVYDPLIREDMKEARFKLSWIVGRDTDQLQQSEIVRGTVETIAENTSDGVTSPLFFALIGGAPLAFVYRAVNTCDSMVGYKNDRFLEFGWASARFDDLLNYIPARLTGWLMILGNRKKKKIRVSWLKQEAKNHPSPNSGWGEAAVAGILGIQLGGTNTYKGVVSHRPVIGEAYSDLEPVHIVESISIMEKAVVWFTVFLLATGGIFLAVTESWG
ncbi:adenosylcobinamide-phosphate synthase CbiB [Fictibacillus phosphorivorans]